MYFCIGNELQSQCSHQYCAPCLEEYYDEDITEILAKSPSWKCPAHRGICYCPKCQESEGDRNMHSKMKRILSNLLGKPKGSVSIVPPPVQPARLEAAPVIPAPVFAVASVSSAAAAVPAHPKSEIRVMNSPRIHAIRKKLLEGNGDAPVEELGRQLDIQAALEYNEFAIRMLQEQKDELPREEVDFAFISLWKNLNALAQSADLAARSGRVADDRTLLRKAKEAEQRKVRVKVNLRNMTITIDKDNLLY